jgi:hypothetical protein
MEHTDLYRLVTSFEERRDDRQCRYMVVGVKETVPAGHVLQVREDAWQIIDEAEQPGYPDAAEATKPLVFPTVGEAALFVYMRKRAFQHFEPVEVPPKRIQIRVTPNFGKRCGCRYGQWVASLYKEDGTAPAGGDCCSDSLEEAKCQGLLKAHLKMGSEPNEEMRRISREVWEVISNDLE